MTNAISYLIDQCYEGAVSDDAINAAATAHRATSKALTAAERFIIGFEGDPMQDGVDELLRLIRAAPGGASAAEPIRAYLEMGPTEMGDDPAIYMDSPTDGDPLILATMKRVHREDMLHLALRGADLSHRIAAAPVSAPQPAAEPWKPYRFVREAPCGCAHTSECANCVTGIVTCNHCGKVVAQIVENIGPPTDEISRLRRELDAADDKYQRDVNGLNNEGDPIGGDPPMGWKQRAERAEAMLAAPTDNTALVEALIAELKGALEFRTGRGDEVGYDNIATGISDSIDIVRRISLVSRDASPTDNTALVEALTRAERKLTAYVGICNGDKELTETVLPMARAALRPQPPRDGG